MTDPARPLARGLPLANRGGGEPPSYQSDGRPPPEILSRDELIDIANGYADRAQKRLDFIVDMRHNPRHVGHTVNVCACCIRQQIAAAFAEGFDTARSNSGGRSKPK